jgi:serine/threonine kinase 32
MGADD